MSEIVLGSVLFTVIVVALALLIVRVRTALLPTKLVDVTINDEKTLNATTGQKLLGVLNDGGIQVPSACAGAGTCGLCRVIVSSGGGHILQTEMAILNAQEVRQGMRLACQVTLRNPMDVRVPAEILGAKSWECTVRSTRFLSPLIKEIVLELPTGTDFKFRAGAFVQVTAPPFEFSFDDIALPPEFVDVWEHLQLGNLKAHSSQPVARAYSVANRPEDKGTIVLNIRLAVPPPETEGVPPGIVSSWLFGLKAKDKVDVAGPYGDFGAQHSDSEMVFIGGGVGIAPLRAIIFDQLERIGTNRKISFWYGARSRHDVLYQEEFDQLAKVHKNFSWTVALSEPHRGDNWEGPVGFIHDVVCRQFLADHPTPEDCEYYLCGPPLMIETIIATLDEAGVESESIFNDEFGG